MTNFAPWPVPAVADREGERVKFSLKRNGISIAASVPTDYFDEHVLPIVTGLLREIGDGTTEARPVATPAAEPSEEPRARERRRATTVRAIAQKLCARTAPQILKAAAISLRLLHEREQFTREELLAEAQSARGFWKKSHAENADEVLEYLLASGTLIETYDGQYTLSSSEEAAALALLA